jgi:hypothetical protein
MLNLCPRVVYITKPFTMEQVREKVAPVIEKVFQRQQQVAAKAAAPAPAPAPPKSGGGFFSKLMG